MGIELPLVIDPQQVRHLVVVQLYFLGDTLLATPALRALRGRFPNARVEVVLKQRSRGALERNPTVDLCTDYDPPHLLQRPMHWRALGQRWQREGVDLAVDLTSDRRSSGLLQAMTPRQAIGFSHPATRAMVQASISKECGEEHVAVHMLRLVGLVGAGGTPELEFHVSTQAAARAMQWALASGSPIVALHPGGNRPLRRWRIERWVELARSLRERGCRVWALGSPAEKPLLEALERANPEDSGAGLSLEDTAARIAQSRLFIGNDSGPMHLASAVATPVLALFGPSLPVTVAPRGHGNFNFHVRMPCCPCDQRRCVQPNDFCMDRISVSSVVNRALDMVREAGKAGRLERE